MKIEYIVHSLLIIFFFFILIFAFKSKKTFFTLIFNALIGLLLFAVLDFSAIFTGVYLPINQYTVIGSATFGIPAVILFLILKLIFI